MVGIKAVFFDLDNTLCDYWASSRQALADALDLAVQRHPAADREALRQDYNAISREAQRATGTEVLSEFGRVQRFSLVLARHNIHDPALAAQLADLFDRQIIARLQPFDDALPVLDALVGRVHLGLVSNGPSAMQREKIAALGIARYFDSIFISEEVGIAKPDPRLFQHILQQTGFLPQDAIYIGDSQDHDVTVAKRSGVRAVWFNRRGRAADPAYPLPDHTVSTLSDFLALLALPQAAAAHPG